jgi:uncharacterized protein involved in exopolysaccharide biosynthesis
MKRSSSGKSSSRVSTERTFQEYLAIISRGKWIILAVFGFVLLATAVYTFLAEPVYTATCQVLLNKAEMKSSSNHSALG